LSNSEANLLEPIAWAAPEIAGKTDSAAEDGNVIIINDNDMSELGTILEAQLETADGNVLTNDQFGADGGHIQSITVSGVTFAFDGTGTVTENGTPLAGYVDHGTWVEITTALGGKLVFYFADTGGNDAGD